MLRLMLNDELWSKLREIMLQHSAGAASDENQAIGKSRGGNTTKIHMAVDAYGLPIDFEITGGEVHDCKVALEFIEKLPTAGHTVADKGYDSVRHDVAIQTVATESHPYATYCSASSSLPEHAIGVI